MAIPFVVPSDEQTEANLTKLLYDLIKINRQVQILLYQRVQNAGESRVSMSRYLRAQQNVNGRMPDLVNSLPFTSVTNARTDIVIPQSQNMAAVSARQRPQRQRTCSESSSCCEQCKDCIVEDTDEVTEDSIIVSAAEVDWNQDDESEQSLTDELLIGSDVQTSKSAMSKLLETTTSTRSVWSAIICGGFVGWHIFCVRQIFCGR